MDSKAGPSVAIGNKRGPSADNLSSDEMCHLFFLRCFGVTVSHERLEDQYMKDKSLALDAFSNTACFSEIAVQHVTVGKRAANSKFSIVSEATDEA